MKKWILLFVNCLLTAVCWAQELDLTLQQVPDKAAFAHPMDIRFELAHTPGYKVRLDAETLPKDFTVLTQEEEMLSPGTVAYHLTVLPFVLGQSTFTAVNFDLLNASGMILAQAETEPVYVQVQPVSLFKDKTLRDIRPPYIPIGWLWWLIAALALFLLGKVAYRFYRRVRADALSAADIPDNRPADEIALSKIQMLLQSGLWEKAEYKLFYTELDDILIEYFWRRFALDVSSNTSAERLRLARTVEELAPLVQSLRSYLHSCDLVKFARAIPTAEIMQRDVHTVQTIIKQTVPPLEPEEIK